MNDIRRMIEQYELGNITEFEFAYWFVTQITPDNADKALATLAETQIAEHLLDEVKGVVGRAPTTKDGWDKGYQTFSIDAWVIRDPGEFRIRESVKTKAEASARRVGVETLRSRWASND